MTKYLFLVLACIPGLLAQVVSQPGGSSTLSGVGAPTNPCTLAGYYIDTTGPTGNSYYCPGAGLNWQLQAGGGGGANTGLTNLAAVSINSALLAQTGIDLGSTVKPFRNLFLSGAGTYGTNYFKFTGTPTGTQTITIPDASFTLCQVPGSSGQIVFNNSGLCAADSGLAYNLGAKSLGVIGTITTGQAGTQTGIVSFNGTTSGTTVLTATDAVSPTVTLPSATGTLALTSVATLSSLASIGTITTGTWNGSVIGTTYGGLGAGLNTAAAHSTIISNGATPAVYLAKTINDCQGTGKALTFTQSTDAYGCNTITGAGTVTVVSSGALTSTALVTGGGTTTLQTPAATATMDASGNISTPGTVTAVSFSASGPTVTGGHGLFCTEAAVPTVGFPAASADGITCDSVTHRMLGSNNNGALSNVVLASDFGTNVGTFLLTPSGANLAAALTTGLPLTAIATEALDTVVMNATAGTAAPTAVAMPTCTAGAVLYNTSTHGWSCVSIAMATTGQSVLANSSATSLVNLSASAAAGDYEIHYNLDLHTACTTGTGQLTLAFGWTANAARTSTTGNWALTSTQGASVPFSGVIPIHVVSGAVTYTPTLASACATGTATWDGDVYLMKVN